MPPRRGFGGQWTGGGRSSSLTYALMCSRAQARPNYYDLMNELAQALLSEVCPAACSCSPLV